MLEGRERRDDRESRGHEAVRAAQKKSSRGRPGGTGGWDKSSLLTQVWDG